MSMDRSSDFVQATKRFAHVRPAAVGRGLAAGKSGGGRLIGEEKSKHEEFLRGSVYVSLELDGLASSVNRFVKDKQGLEDGGASMAQKSEQIKHKMDQLSKFIKGLVRIMEASRSRQLREHYGIILKTLQQRFERLGKLFFQTVQRRTKALSSKQAQQAGRFGASKVQLSAPVFAGSAGGGGGGDLLPQRQAHSSSPVARRPAGFAPKPVGYAPKPAGYTPGGAVGGGVGGVGVGVSVGVGGGAPLRRRGGAAASTAYGGGGNAFGAQSAQQSAQMPQAFSNPYAAGAVGYARSKKDDDAQASQQQQQFSARQVAMYDRQTIEKKRLAIEMQNVQKTITEVGQMYMQVANLVSEQEELTNQIGMDIDESLDHVQSGREQLLIYYNTLSQERQLILKLLLVTLCLGTFFIYSWR